MINCSKKNINIISLIITTVIFFIIILTLNSLKISKREQKTISTQSNIYQNNIIQETKLESINMWKIIIEKLKLEANIKEGTEDSIIKENVGHYITSGITKGNISLKAFNIGENKKYFANLKELEIGDEIIYIVNQEKYTYKVISNTIIDNEEEWISKNKSENTLTLITYIKDLENKKRCVIAKKV